MIRGFAGWQNFHWEPVVGNPGATRFRQELQGADDRIIGSLFSGLIHYFLDCIDDKLW
jgi:hypothetical protein